MVSRPFTLILSLLLSTGLAAEPTNSQDDARVDADALAGEASAYFELGITYYWSPVPERDYRKAAQWFRRAAEAGHVRGQFYLGALYEGGEGVPQDYAQARYWYERAAGQGSAYAQYGLGLLYFNVSGAPRDLEQAHKWLNIAATRGHPLAPRTRERVTGMMSVEQAAEAQRLAREWLQQHEE